MDMITIYNNIVVIMASAMPVGVVLVICVNVMKMIVGAIRG